MARLGAVVLIFLAVVATFASNTECRKLLMSSSTTQVNNKQSTVSSFASLVLSALPKGTVPPSSPSNKGHATIDNEQLFARHLASIDRILNSVPSPGAGH